MNEDIFNRLKDFIIRQTFVSDVEITSETIIESEFGITGDDADDFIIAFGKEFNVDVSDFEIGKYFRGEGDGTLKSLLEMMRGKKAKEKFSLKVGDLGKAILKGKLDESIFNDH